jgi:hypothetical protein
MTCEAAEKQSTARSLCTTNFSAVISNHSSFNASSNTPFVHNSVEAIGADPMFHSGIHFSAHEHLKLKQGRQERGSIFEGELFLLHAQTPRVL